VDDHRAGDDEIGRSGGAGRRRGLPHPVANHLAAAELRFVAVDGGVALDPDDEVGVGETDAVAGGRTVVVGVGAAIDLHCAAFTNASAAASASARTLSS